jgi:hypothetical protein
MFAVQRIARATVPRLPTITNAAGPSPRSSRDAGTATGTTSGVTPSSPGPEWGSSWAPRTSLGSTSTRCAPRARVELVSPRLAYLQITADPTDDLRDDFEARLEAARMALAPISQMPLAIASANPSAGSGRRDDEIGRPSPALRVEPGSRVADPAQARNSARIGVGVATRTALTMMRPP